MSSKIQKKDVLRANGGANSHSSLDTLAQLDHFDIVDPIQTLRRRALAKFFTSAIIFPLIDLKNEREKSYWHTYHCVNLLEQHEDGRHTSRYCRNRFCIVCNRIRTATMIRKYGESIKSVPTEFITLTTHLTKTCFTRKDLNKDIKAMKDAFVRVYRRLKRKYGSVSLIRKLEVTWNEVTKTYHPHFHIISENIPGVSEFIVSHWLKEFPKSSKYAQNTRITDENTIIELFKYTTKMWSKDFDENSKMKLVLPYPAVVMDNIFSVLYRSRTFEVYGKLFRNIDDDFTTEEATVVVENEARKAYWIWEQSERTWINIDTGEYRT